MIQSSLKIILGSSSIYRAKLLSRYVSDFESIAPEIDESQYINESPQDLSMHQVVSFKKINIGKKINYKSAYQTLIEFSGKKIYFYTSVVIVIKEKKIELTHLDKTMIEFKPFGKKELEAYLKSQDIFDSTAAIKYESKQFQQLVNQIITEDEEAIIGLPMIWLMEQLKKLELNKI